MLKCSYASYLVLLHWIYNHPAVQIIYFYALYIFYVHTFVFCTIAMLHVSADVVLVKCSVLPCNLSVGLSCV